MIFDLFKINIHKHPTLTSIAFSLYLRNFIESANIPVSSLSFYNNTKSGYMGGTVDVYRPKIQEGYYYDENSLYPTVFKANPYPYPVGRGYSFRGYRPLSSLFGIVYCTVEAPKDLYAAILMYRDNNSTIAPLGIWSGWYFIAD